MWGAQTVIPLVAYSKLSVPFWVQRVPFPAVLCHFQNPAGPEQLEQVADRAHQLPLAADILFATQAEAAKTALFLDLSENRLDDCLAQSSQLHMIRSIHNRFVSPTPSIRSAVSLSGS